MTAGQVPADPLPGEGAKDTGRKKSTINDIARLAGVSKKTVSRVINDSPFVRDETRKRIQAIIQDIGFAPDPQARGLAFRRSFLFSMIYDNPTPQYVVNMMQGLLDGLNGSGFELVIRPCNRTDSGFLDNMRDFVERQKLSGVALPPSVSEDEKLVKVLRQLECPYVRIAAISLDEPRRMVVTHDSAGAAAAARHLTGLGHRVIGHISGPSSFLSAHVRREGFIKGLAESGLTLDPAYDIEGAYTFDSGMEAARKLLSLSPRPTAIFTGNDEMAAGVYRAARNMGLEIPRDLSVVGFDDSPIAARMWPILTSVRLPIHEMGRRAAEKLILQRNGLFPERAEEAISPALIVRDSTGPSPER